MQAPIQRIPRSLEIVFIPQTPGESSAAGFWMALSLGNRCYHAPSFERHPFSLSEALMEDGSGTRNKHSQIT